MCCSYMRRFASVTFDSSTWSIPSCTAGTVQQETGCGIQKMAVIYYAICVMWTRGKQNCAVILQGTLCSVTIVL